MFKKQKKMIRFTLQFIQTFCRSKELNFNNLDELLRPQYWIPNMRSALFRNDFVNMYKEDGTNRQFYVKNIRSFSLIYFMLK